MDNRDLTRFYHMLDCAITILNFSVDDSTVSWPNEVDFCPDVLYKMGREVKVAPKTTLKHSRGRVTSSSRGRKHGPMVAKSKF